jgi:hypothetical protein
MEVKKRLAEISIPSTEIERRQVEDSRGALTLRYSFYVGDRLRQGGVEFLRRRAYRYRAESHCTVWHLDAYDTLVEVENSEWVAELLEAMPEDMRDLFEMHHYMIYLDSSGCYEVVAASWQFLPEVEVADGE